MVFEAVWIPAFAGMTAGARIIWTFAFAVSALSINLLSQTTATAPLITLHLPHYLKSGMT